MGDIVLDEDELQRLIQEALINKAKEIEQLQSKLKIARDALEKQKQDCETHYEELGMSVYKVMAMEAEAALEATKEESQ